MKDPARGSRNNRSTGCASRMRRRSSGDGNSAPGQDRTRRRGRWYRKRFLRRAWPRGRESRSRRGRASTFRTRRRCVANRDRWWTSKRHRSSCPRRPDLLRRRRSRPGLLRSRPSRLPRCERCHCTPPRERRRERKRGALRPERSFSERNSRRRHRTVRRRRERVSGDGRREQPARLRARHARARRSFRSLVGPTRHR